MATLLAHKTPETPANKPSPGFMCQKWVEDPVKSGGGVAIGNFSDNNPSRDYMESGDWFLHHRSDDQLFELARSCGVPTNNIAVEKEPEGVNLFLRIQKN